MEATARRLAAAKTACDTVEWLVQVCGGGTLSRAHGRLAVRRQVCARLVYGADPWRDAARVPRHVVGEA